MQTKNKRPCVSVIGAANLDMEMHLLSPWHNAESNPVRRVERTGGVAANVAKQLAQTCKTHLYTSLGDDIAGKKIGDDLGANNVLLNNLGREHPTGIYIAVLENNGELKAGLADTAGIESVGKQQWLQINEHLQNQQAVCFDCNCNESLISAITNSVNSAASNARATSDADNRPVRKPLLAALGVSPAKIKKLTAFTTQIDLLFANRRELQALTGLDSSNSLVQIALAVHDAGIKQIVATDGPGHIVIIDQGHVAELPVQPLPAKSGSVNTTTNHSDTVRASVNGAGDALAGATLAALLQQVPLKTAVRKFGIVAASKQVSPSKVNL